MNRYSDNGIVSVVEYVLGLINRRVFFTIGVIIYIFLFKYAYTKIISINPIFYNVGFRSYAEQDYSFYYSMILCIIPAFWINRKLERPSDIIVLYMYFFVYLPSCIYLNMSVNLKLDSQIKFGVFLLISIAILETRRMFNLNLFKYIAMKSDRGFLYTLLAVGVAALAIMIFIGHFDLTILTFEDVYERRSALVQDAVGVQRLVFYVANWSALAISPVMIGYSIFRGNRYFLALGLVIAIVAFVVTSFRSHLFLPIFVAALCLPIKYFGRRYIGALLLAVSIILCAAPLAYDLWIDNDGLQTWGIQFRFIGNNGFLSAQYFSFFENMPKGLYYDSFGRFFVERRYFITIAETVGGAFSTDSNHANANLWADGYGNLGVFGMMFGSLSLVALMAVIDSLGARKDARLVAALCIAPSFAVANTAVHTMLTSSGGALLIVLLMLMPISAPTSAGGRDRHIVDNIVRNENLRRSRQRPIDSHLRS